ncbi:MAG TPA: tetratricopeptide repeat protein [Acidobacteriota bacterium]|nr:tetratricopeptide repeat protein [Acidobacteriota bacterium]
MYAKRGGAQRLHCSRHLISRRYQVRRILESLVSVVLVTLFLTGCPQQVVRIPVTPENIIRANEVARDGDLAFARKDFYAALIKYLEASKNNPNSEYIFNKLGITYSQLKYYTEATAAFQHSIGLNSKYPYSYNNLGSVYFANNDLKKAERYFRKAIGMNGNVASFHVNLGTLYFERKKFDKGMAEWRRGIALDPGILTKGEGISLAASTTKGTSVEKSFFMARLYASMGDADHAVENLQQALNAGFTNIEAIRTEPDFDPIRQSEKFQTFMRTAALLGKP